MSTPQVIRAPSEEQARHPTTVLLAGFNWGTHTPGWCDTFSNSLSGVPVTIYNPHGPNWNSSISAWVQEQADAWEGKVEDIREIRLPELNKQIKWEQTKTFGSTIGVVPLTRGLSSLAVQQLVNYGPKMLLVCGPSYPERQGLEQACAEHEELEIFEDLNAAADRIKVLVNA